MIRFLIMLLTLVSTIATADSVVKYGANVSSEHEKLGSTKAIFLSYQDVIFGPFIKQYELGGWFDNTGIQGRRSSALLGASAGIHVNAGYLFAQALIGPCAISNTDSNLGGHFQFNNDIGLGLRDPETKSTIGLAYKHISSAGIFLPNKGRDLIMFRVSIPY